MLLKKMTTPTLFLIGLCLVAPFIVDFHPPLFEGLLIRFLENIQALLLLLAAVFTYLYSRSLANTVGQKQFWFWAVLWWVMLFGRSISWGRDYFPEISHDYFRVISIFFIAPVVFMLFSKCLRQEIMHKLATMRFPIYSFLLAVVTLIISDSIEHSRMIAPLFLHHREYKDLMEELYEFPLIWGLFETTYLLMKQEKSA
ncbi:MULTISPECIES: hypothetical protein [unclassified Acinetobacter]|uniref:hypothetical protein n=1 Tax=unclassified Acinetobacter TaxID=196816 RepID=UPI00293426F6|nr:MULTISPECIES: hypothetical protein [unclassified Acinetobacter]WOE31902.1 hypothetical protein QSG84_01365 [Acinetobacter sp. SAAs470]WOE37369.1 hypothetical protein QSG86_10410 [Acinetobacter sp. SAAs474]